MTEIWRWKSRKRVGFAVGWLMSFSEVSFGQPCETLSLFLIPQAEEQIPPQAELIDTKKLIDSHYDAIAAKARLDGWLRGSPYSSHANSLM